MTAFFLDKREGRSQEVRTMDKRIGFFEALCFTFRKRSSTTGTLMWLLCKLMCGKVAANARARCRTVRGWGLARRGLRIKKVLTLQFFKSIEVSRH